MSQNETVVTRTHLEKRQCGTEVSWRGLFYC